MILDNEELKKLYKNLDKLTEIDLSHKNYVKIKKDAFNDCKNLTGINLSYN